MQDHSELLKNKPPRRTFLKYVATGSAAVAGIGSVQANEETSHEEPDREVGGTQVQRRNVEDADALLLKRCEPWEYASNEAILDELGINYGVEPLGDGFDVDAIPFQELDMMIIPSTQDQQFYDTIIAEMRDEILNWVANGGTLVAHMTTTGWPCNAQWPEPFLPRGVTTSDGNLFDGIGITAPDHPLTENLTENDLSGWGASSHGRLENLPDDANIIWGEAGAPESNPAYVEYGYEDGRVLATMQTMEWGLSQIGISQHLINEFRYAAEGGADLPGDEPALALEDLAVNSVIEGEAAQGEQIELTATATNTTDAAVSNEVSVNFDGSSVGSFSLEVGAGNSVDIFADLDVGTLVEPGETSVGFQTSGVEQNVVSPDSTLSASNERVDDQDAMLPTDINNEANVLLIKDRDPWGAAGNEIVLDRLNISYSRVNSGDLDQVPDMLPDYNVVLFPSVQDQTFMDRMSEYRDVFDDFVTNGGTLVAHMCHYNGDTFPQFLPQGIGTQSELYGQVSIVNDHPVVDGFSDGDLSGWNYSTHGNFTGVDDDASVVTGIADAPLDLPAYLAYGHGDGLVLASMHTMEWPFASDSGSEQLLENELAFAADADGGGGGGGDEVTTDLLIRELGDVNHDGSIGPSDAVFTHRHIQGLSIDDQFNPQAADLNQDGEVSMLDVQIIYDKTVGNEAGVPEREAGVENAGPQ